jgi:hypothetical protein
MSTNFWKRVGATSRDCFPVKPRPGRRLITDSPHILDIRADHCPTNDRARLPARGGNPTLVRRKRKSNARTPIEKVDENNTRKKHPHRPTTKPPPLRIRYEPPHHQQSFSTSSIKHKASFIDERSAVSKNRFCPLTGHSAGPLFSFQQRKRLVTSHSFLRSKTLLSESV